MHLTPQTIVLVLAGQSFALESGQNISDSSCRFSQHGLAGNTQGQLASVLQFLIIRTNFYQSSNQFLLIRKLSYRFLNGEFVEFKVFVCLHLSGEQLFEES